MPDEHGVIVHGIRVAGFRSFGAEPQEITGLSRLNIFIGKNNAGKSNLLRLISMLGPAVSGALAFNESEFNTSCKHAVLQAQLPFAALQNSEAFRKCTGRLTPAGRKYLESTPIWVGAASKTTVAPEEPVDSNLHSVIREAFPGDITPLLHSYGIQRYAHSPEAIEEVINRWDVRPLIQIPQVIFVPHFRQIGIGQEQQSPMPSNAQSFDGRELIETLFKYQTVTLVRRDDLTIIDKINSFVADVLGDPDARIRIPHSKENIIVHKKSN